jgi:hypothetical protein
MRIGNWVRVIAVASLVGAGAATPAWSHGDRYTLQNGDTVTTVQNGDSATFHSWAATAAQNSGVIREDAFLDEMGRRWDAAPDQSGSRGLYLNSMRARWEAIDPDNQGLTPAQVSELTGNVDSSALPTESGTDVQPGNMGSGNMKGQ